MSTGNADSPLPILARYRGAPWPTQLFLRLRWQLTPYDALASQLPPKGRILDLGCGHGLFSLAAAVASPEREILAVDHDEDRIRLAVRAAEGLPNLRFEAQSLLTSLAGEKEAYAAVALIDVLHYFDPPKQRAILSRAHDALEEGGTLLLREIDREGRFVSRWTQLYERLAVGVGFTRAERSDLHFRSREEWKSLLRELGFGVRVEPYGSPLFADVLFVGRRPS